MRLEQIRQPRFFIPIGILLVFVVTTAIVFNPSFQKKMLLKYSAMQVDKLTVDYIHLTPWSLDVRGLSFDYRKGRFQLGHGMLRFCLTSLLVDRLNFRQIVFDNIEVDISEFEMPEDETRSGDAFPGLFASLDQGYAYILEELSISIELKLPAGQSLSAKVEGAHIRPDEQSNIAVNMHFDMGRESDHIIIDGATVLNQLSEGKFDSISSAFEVQLDMQGLPVTEHTTVQLNMMPLVVATAQEESETAIQELELQQDVIDLTLLQHDGKGVTRTNLNLEGIYDGNVGKFTGEYVITANEALVGPYLSGYTPPNTRQTLTGEINFNLQEVLGDITILSDMEFTDLQEKVESKKFPALLKLNNNFRISLLSNRQLRIQTLDARMSDNQDNPSLTASLPSDLNISLDNIDEFFKQENILLEFELPGVPLVWFDTFVPGYEIVDGRLSGAFRVMTDSTSAIILKAIKPLTVTDLHVLHEGNSIIPKVDISVVPDLVYKKAEIQLGLKQLSIIDSDQSIINGDIKINHTITGEKNATSKFIVSADLNTEHFLSYLNIQNAGLQRVPQHFSIDIQTEIKQLAKDFLINEISAALNIDNGTQLLSAKLLQPIKINQIISSNLYTSSEGKLARVDLADIQLGWFSAFIPNFQVEGALGRASFIMTANADGQLNIEADKPIQLNDLKISEDDTLLLEGLKLSVLPAIQLTHGSTLIHYNELEIKNQKLSIASGQGEIILPADANSGYSAQGKATIDLEAISQQPLVSRLLQGPIDSALKLQADYQFTQTKNSVQVRRINAGLFYAGPEPRISLNANSEILIRTRMSAKEPALRRADGVLSLSVKRLTSEPFSKVLKKHGLNFTEINGDAVLVSEGDSFRIESIKPIRVDGMQIQGKDGALLHPFSIVAQTGAVMTSNSLRLNMDQMHLVFDQQKEISAISGTARMKFGHGNHNDTRVKEFTAKLSASLPVVLNQPAILPKHKLKAGLFDAEFNLNSKGSFDSNMRIHGLKGGKKLALKQFEVQLDGKLHQDGSFEFSAPVKTTGKSGDSNLLIDVATKKQLTDVDTLSASITSNVFFLNDILNTLNAIIGNQQLSPREKAKKPKAKKVAEEKIPNKQPANRAFWNVFPYNSTIDYKINQLFYTDYLIIKDIEAKAELSADKVSLSPFTAYFHDSPIKLNSIMDFNAGDTPYSLKLDATIDQFDLAKFFRELVPDSKPRAEGLFDIKLNASGQSPNILEYRNQLLFDMRLLSREGVFRLLDPNSALVGGSTNVLGALGEGISYVPTGLFGLGAVSRLANYIKEIEYDKIDVRLARDDTRDITIRRYNVQNPELRMTAKGGVKYIEGKDILGSPLEMNARLSFRGHGAAIMYDLNLLENEKDDRCYWKGPDIRFWGTPAAMESNLDDIISKAGNAAVLGGVTRPISGLIGNVKYRWFGDDASSEECSQ